MYAKSHAITDKMSVFCHARHAIRPKSSKNFWPVPGRDEMPWGCHEVTGD